jgi:hypothetical protein
VKYGARRADIRIVHLASEDDPTTPDADESRRAALALMGRVQQIRDRAAKEAANG